MYFSPPNITQWMQIIIQTIWCTKIGCFTCTLPRMAKHLFHVYRWYAILHKYICQQPGWIAQTNDGTIMLSHMQSHGNQCPLRQGHWDEMWWMRWKTPSDAKIYFVSIQKLWEQQFIQSVLALCTKGTLPCLPNSPTLNPTTQVLPIGLTTLERVVEMLQHSLAVKNKGGVFIRPVVNSYQIARALQRF